MKLTDNLVETFGEDKLLHFSFSALFCALFLPFDWIFMGLACIIIMVISAIKEVYLDAYADWKDFLFAVFGMTMVIVYKLIIMLL